MKVTLLVTAGAVACAGVLIASCSGTSLHSIVENHSSVPPLLSRVDRSADFTRLLYVSLGTGAIAELAPTTYKHVGEITKGISNPDGIWVDAHQNLYVTNLDSNVVEYKPGDSSPACTYSANLVDPVDVTTDGAGNVFVADFNDGRTPGHVDEFKQCRDATVRRYAVDKPEGVAVDTAGDIFVSYFGPRGFGNFEEFKGGSSIPTRLHAYVIAPAGLILDSKRDLIADDQDGRIDVFPPPYRSGRSIAFELSLPFHCSLNKAETLLFNANAGGNGSVTVYQYPSGKLLKTLADGDGIRSPVGVAFSPDAAF